MSPTQLSSARSRRITSLVLLGIALTACGTTEARSNKELEPGSGDLGTGDAAEQTDTEDVVEPEDELTDDGAELTDDAESTPSSVPTIVGPSCATDEARAEIGALPARVHGNGFAIEDRHAAIQLGSDPDVAERLRTQRDRAAAVDDDITRSVVTRVLCVDDGSAIINVSLYRGQTRTRFEGSAMLVDGSWRVTLHAFCRWNLRARCDEREGLPERALAALSPALRRELGLEAQAE
ncbi:MAG: hypothetical protein ACT4OX_08115 [Actinomycetota bacterium]